MDVQILKIIENYLNFLKKNYLSDIVSNPYLIGKFSKYKYLNRIYIGFDIDDNYIKNMKCYVGSKKDSTNKFNENHCNMMLNKSIKSNKNLFYNVFNVNNFCLTENSFSLFKKFNKDLVPQRDVFIGRFKNLTEEKINNVLDDIMKIGKNLCIKEDIRNCINIIKNENNTQKHPVFIIALDMHNLLSVNAIKMYYDLCKFEKYYDEFGYNDFIVSSKIAEKLISIAQNTILKEKYQNIVEYFKQEDAVLTMYCVNYNKNSDNVYKLYFTEGNKQISNRIKFVSELHKIIFGNEMTKLNQEILSSTINSGFNLAEMCVAANNKSSQLKIYFELDNY